MTQKTIIGYKLVKEYPLKQIGDMVVLKKLSNGWYWEKNIIEKNIIDQTMDDQLLNESLNKKLFFARSWQTRICNCIKC